MTRSSFRPTVARTQNAMKTINGTKTNATIRNIEEEEGELEEKEGVVVSIKRDLINGAGWTVKDKEGQKYVCSCASSMYEIPETVERGGILYPKDKVEVTFTVNPVLRINTIKEIKSLGKETGKIDISQWKHGEESTTVIAKPKSALSISDGLIKLDYNNTNQVTADNNGISTKGESTNINTQTLSINSDNISIKGTSLSDILQDSALTTSNEHKAFNVASSPTIDMVLDRSNNITQLTVQTPQDETIKITGQVIGQIKDQESIPIRTQTQQLLTDGNCISILTIDTDGIISISPTSINPCTGERKILSTHNWITPRIQSRNYIKTTVKQTCDNCNNGNNSIMEYINYCPSCNRWNVLSNTDTLIRCSCGALYCQNCGTNINDESLQLKEFLDYYIAAYGTTCEYCKDQLESGTTKYYVNYCPNCQTWSALYSSERFTDEAVINILKCNSCDSEFCSSCGIDQDKHGITLTNNPVQYKAYKDAIRKLKYIKNGA